MNTPTRKTVRAFTLIELLTVIAIIGILAAIIIPTVGRVRDSARQTKCLSNLRQSTTAFLMLVNENKGMYSGRFGGTDQTILEWTIELERKGFVGIKKQGSNNLNAIDIYFCPFWSPEAAIADNKWQTYGLNMMSGAANPRMGGNGTTSSTNGTNVYKINYNAVSSASRFPLMADSYTSGNKLQIFRLLDNIDSGGVHLRHQDKAHVSFLDGHVQKMDAEQLAVVGFKQAWSGSKEPVVKLTLPTPSS